VSGIRRLLNETALTQLGNIRVSLPEQKQRRKRKKAKKFPQEASTPEISVNEKTGEPKQLEATADEFDLQESRE